MRTLEFYAGVGGLHYSLLRAREDAEVVAAFDINPVSNRVYEHNHKLKPVSKSISELSPRVLDSYEADAWLLSPPCQPYTRQGHQLGSADPRAESFILLLDKLDEVEKPPKYLLIENVVGFEESATRDHLIRTLRRNKYTTQEYLVSPLDLGLPYSRARYFCLAKLAPLKFADPSQDFRIKSGPPRGTHGDAAGPQTRRPLKDFLSADLSFEAFDRRQPGDLWEEYLVKASVREKYLGCVDLVSPLSMQCCCFTKSYYKFLKGTGSIIAVNALHIESAEEKDFVQEDGRVRIRFYTGRRKGRQNLDKTDDEILDSLVLRYFTPREVANLHSFPSDFDFPPDVTKKQRYALLGNSLSVAVVTDLLSYLFEEIEAPQSANQV